MDINISSGLLQSHIRELYSDAIQNVTTTSVAIGETRTPFGKRVELQLVVSRDPDDMFGSINPDRECVTFPGPRQHITQNLDQIHANLEKTAHEHFERSCHIHESTKEFACQGHKKRALALLPHTSAEHQENQIPF